MRRSCSLTRKFQSAPPYEGERNCIQLTRNSIQLFQSAPPYEGERTSTSTSTSTKVSIRAPV